MNYNILGLQQRIAGLRSELLKHPLYAHLNTLEDLQIFMSHHIYAVWDFMALLKALQVRLTSTSEAWVPTESPVARRLINEIVWCEESDIDINGEAASHYEMYLQAMKQAGTSTASITNFVDHLKRGYSYKSMVKYNVAEVEEAILSFIGCTYRIIQDNKTHEIAAAFTFGREDLIPDLFTEIVRDLDKKLPGKLDAFIYYLDRHIEIDGDEHGPMAHKMVSELCGNDETKWQEAENAAYQALEARLKLWDAILIAIEKNSNKKSA